MMRLLNFCLLALLAAACFMHASASDPSQLQDFCVAVNEPKAAVFMNGKFCKDPKLVEANDFFYSGLQNPGNTNNTAGLNVTTVFATQLPGLNTLGISLVRIDFAPYGRSQPHIHPRGTEVLTVLEGTLLVGFVTSIQDNYRLFTKVLEKGDVFVFPEGLIHFNENIGNTKAVAIAALSSQNPGVITIGSSLFGSTPPISVDVLARALRLEPDVVKSLEAKFAPMK